jgi:hypothetical protein
MNDDYDYLEYGEISLEALRNRNEYVVYKSNSICSKMQFGFINETICNSTLYSDCMKRELSKLKCKISLGVSGSKYKNGHIYTNGAENLDGTKRICYIKNINDDEILITECKRDRDSNYSALWDILKNKLNKIEVFKYKDDQFKINIKNIDLFIEAVNKIIEDYNLGKYKYHIPNDKYDKICKIGQYYYYNIIRYNI